MNHPSASPPPVAPPFGSQAPTPAYAPVPEAPLASASLRDRAFQATFARMFVYNILFEDTEVDERYLGVGEDSTILGITGAGCGIAGLLSRRPRSIDAVDINRQHLALAALKAAAAQRLSSYATFYDLFGRGWHADPAGPIARAASGLPSWIQAYWRRNHSMFRRGLYGEGLTSRMLAMMRRASGVDGAWLAEMARRPVEERLAAVDARIAPIFRAPGMKAFLSSPAQLVALGINYAQRDRLLASERTDLADYFVTHVKRVASTDLETNWFAWYANAGHFNHDRADAVPPYLRADRHEASLGAPTRTSWSAINLFDALAEEGRHTWSHYLLCDAPDWMPAPTQRRLLQEILRTSRDGAVVLCRSVEDIDIVERAGMGRHFRLKPESAEATRLDRSRQYRRVNLYEVCH